MLDPDESLLLVFLDGFLVVQEELPIINFLRYFKENVFIGRI